MATFLLVHGAWHGGWCWKKVTPLLRAGRQEVFTPTLTGLGERAHLLNPAISLNTHVQDIVAVLEYEDLHGVALVGHSYGGMVITAVADRVPERLEHLVYLDAFVPKDGESTMDLMSANSMENFRERARAHGEGWWIPAGTGTFSITSDADIQWLQARLVPHPLKTLEQPLRLTNEAAALIPRTYIYCVREGAASPRLARSAERARAEQGWRYRELATGHDAMVSAPQQLAELLLELV